MVAGGLMIATAWGGSVLALIDDHHALTDILAEAVGVLLLILAWRYRRDRLAVAAIIISGANTLVRTGAIPNPENAGGTALAVVLAIDICLLAITRDRALWRLPSLAWMIWIAAQSWFVVFGIHLVNDATVGWLENPAASPAALICSAIVVFLSFILRRGAFEAALSWVSIAAAIVLLDWRDPHSASLLFAAAQLTLLVGVFEDSYRLAFHDDLTGLSGRRALNEALRNISGAFSIAMVDIDHFKRFNDRHGHDAGDQVLRMVADELAKTGGGGRVYRYGGEEFTIIYSGKGVPEIRDTLDVIRSSIAARKFALRAPDRPRTRPEKPTKSVKAPKRVTVQVSIGVAGTNTRRTTADAVLKAADRALYRAKKAGRNRMVAAGDRLGKRG